MNHHEISNCRCRNLNGLIGRVFRWTLGILQGVQFPVLRSVTLHRLVSTIPRSWTLSTLIHTGSSEVFKRKNRPTKISLNRLNGDFATSPLHQPEVCEAHRVAQPQTYPMSCPYLLLPLLSKRSSTLRPPPLRIQEMLDRPSIAHLCHLCINQHLIM